MKRSWRKLSKLTRESLQIKLLEIVAAKKESAEVAGKNDCAEVATKDERAEVAGKK